MNWQVSDLESSRKLKELGVGQRSLFYWVGVMKDVKGSPVGHIKQGPTNLGSGTNYSAFTCAELGVALPPSVLTKYGHEHKEVYLYLICNRHPDIRKGFRCEYWAEYNEEARQWFNNGSYGSGFMELTEAQARSKMLIYLLENKLTTVEEINARLLGVGNDV